MLLVILQVIVGLFVIGMGIEMSIKGPSVKKHKWGYRWVFILLGAVTILITIFQFKDQTAKDSEHDSQLQAIDAKERAIQKDQKATEAHMESIVKSVTANPSIPPDIKERVVEAEGQVLESKEDITNLDSLKAVLDNKRQQGELNDEENKRQLDKMGYDIYKECFTYYEYASRALETTLRDFGKTQGDTVSSNFDVLPEHLSDGFTRVCEIKMVNDPKWTFQVRIRKNGRINRMSPPSLVINAENTELDIVYQSFDSNRSVSATITDTNRRPVYEGDKASLYRTTIDKAMLDLIAARAEAVGK